MASKRREEEAGSERSKLIELLRVKLRYDFLRTIFFICVGTLLLIVLPSDEKKLLPEIIRIFSVFIGGYGIGKFSGQDYLNNLNRFFGE